MGPDACFARCALPWDLRPIIFGDCHLHEQLAGWLAVLRVSLAVNSTKQCIDALKLA